MIYPAAFRDYCASIESRLTSLRKSILYILWHAGKPLKAYEVLDELLQFKPNSRPPTVYRVLDYFVDCGVVHKIESIQSYTLCREPEKQLASEILMVCNRCHSVREVYDRAMISLVQRLSAAHLFIPGAGVIELKGFCHGCHEV